MKRKMMIKSLPEAMEMLKEMNVLSEDEWTGDYRQSAKDAIASFLTSRMNDRVTYHLAQTEAKGIPDRRNGSYLRHLFTELGDVVLSVPRTRTYTPIGVIRSYVRRSQDVDRLILSSFLLGLSTRKVGEALLSTLGEKISPSTVSRAA
ncbi:MAG: transposase, partial [Syntrophorhabdaceae bacterium]|nr:transposase [Syntrophorhabdaceae bacterium]